MISQQDLTKLHAIRDRVKEKMVGIDEIINLLLIAILVRGHVLLEGNPGLGKTALIRALSDAMDFPRDQVGRIQFTPDLMPSDITGTKMPTGDNKLEFEPGPIFCRLLLADEINRATPKTQAAMLEAMAEFQVTVLGQQYPLTETIQIRDGTDLDVQTPFMVMATQNPVEQEGTYELPEAQLDRFLFKAIMPFPRRETLEKIVLKDAGPQEPPKETAAFRRGEDHPVLANLHRLGRGLRKTEISDVVQMHIMNIILASVGMFDQMHGLSSTGEAKLKDFHRDHIDYELGPRAATSLTLATVGWAAVAEANPAELTQLPAKTADSLAKISVPVLRHRMRFRFGYDVSGDAANMHDDMVRQFVSLCAPAREGHDQSFAAAIQAASETARF